MVVECECSFVVCGGPCCLFVLLPARVCDEVCLLWCEKNICGQDDVCCAGACGDDPVGDVC